MKTVDGVAAEKPSETIAAAAKTKVLVNDSRGRLIAVHRLNALQFYQLTKAMGMAASNPATMDLAIIASSVRRVDTLDFAAPRTEADVQFLIQTLDFDGIAAAAEGLKQLNANDDEGIAAAKN